MDWFALLVFTGACVSSGLVVGFMAGRIDAENRMNNRRATHIEGDN